MVVFMLLAMPLAWAFLFSRATVRGDLRRTVRNPIVGALLAFAAYLIVVFILMPGYPPDRLPGSAFAAFSAQAFLLPLGFGAIVFALAFRGVLLLPEPELLIAVRSYFAVFLTCHAVLDLVTALNVLGPAELFLVPAARVAQFVVLTRLIAGWRRGWRRSLPSAALVAVCHLACAAGIMLIWVGELWFGAGLFVVAMVPAVLVEAAEGRASRSEPAAA